ECPQRQVPYGLVSLNHPTHSHSSLASPQVFATLRLMISFESAYLLWVLETGSACSGCCVNILLSFCPLNLTGTVRASRSGWWCRAAVFSPSKRAGNSPANTKISKIECGPSDGKLS